MRLKDLTDQWLIKTHFFGIYRKVDKDDDEWKAGEVCLANPKNPSERLPRSVINDAIEQAVANLEDKILARIKGNEHIVEHHDYDKDLFSQFMFVPLREYPVRRVHSLKMVYGENGSVVWDVPPELIQAKLSTDGIGSRFGYLQILPFYGISTSVGFDPATFTLLQGTMVSPTAPSLIRAEYDAGMDLMENDLPPAVVRAIGLIAAIHPLNIMGDIVIGAGIANVSMSFDGFSESIGTTASAENSAYSSRIIMHRKELYGEQQQPGLLDTLKGKWRRTPLGIF